MLWPSWKTLGVINLIEPGKMRVCGCNFKIFADIKLHCNVVGLNVLFDDGSYSDIGFMYTNLNFVNSTVNVDVNYFDMVVLFRLSSQRKCDRYILCFHSQ